MEHRPEIDQSTWIERPDPYFPRIIIGMIIGCVSMVVFITRSWTLQAFVPEPYFLRTATQLQELSSEGTPPDIRRSLEPLNFVITTEIIILAAIAVIAIFYASRWLTVAYVFTAIGMALITFLRLTEAIHGVH